MSDCVVLSAAKDPLLMVSGKARVDNLAPVNDKPQVLRSAQDDSAPEYLRTRCSQTIHSSAPSAPSR